MNLDLHELVAMPTEDLDKLRSEILNGIDGLNESETLANSVSGKKFAKRLSADLDAIKSKYVNIAGDRSRNERLAELDFLRGREFQLVQELRLLTNAKADGKELSVSLDLIEQATSQKKKQFPTR